MDVVLAPESPRRAGDGAAAGRFRILVGEVSHEVRNVCGAIAVIHENLVRGRLPNRSKDFEALGSMVETLNKTASLKLKQIAPELQPNRYDLVETPGDVRIWTLTARKRRFPCLPRGSLAYGPTGTACYGFC